MARMKKKLLWTTAIALGVTLLAWPKVRPLVAAPRKPATATASRPSGAALPPLRVNAVTVKPQLFSETITTSGTLRAEEGVDLQVEISGKVVAINFQEGSSVKKGDLLLKINDSELQAALARATYRKQIVELKEARLAPLLKNGGVPQQDYDAVLNDLNVQKAEIDLINAQIAKSEVRAPFDGVIGLRFVSEGAFITATSNAATRIATLQSIQNLKVDFNVPERFASRIKAGTPILFSVVGDSRKHHGTIYAIEPRIDVATRTVLLRALCPNPGTNLFPGAFASVEFPLTNIENAILVPSVAVVSGLNEKNVFVVNDGKVSKRKVEIGTRTESQVHILAGLTPGDQVVVSALQQMRPGLDVQITENPAPRAASRTAKDAINAGDPKTPAS